MNCQWPCLLLLAALPVACDVAPAPVPRQSAQDAFLPAPTPDTDVAERGRTEVRVQPDFVTPYRDGFESNGYPQGSVYRNWEDDPTSRGPGVNVHVPVE